jgi:hypothetical protein
VTAAVAESGGAPAAPSSSRRHRTLGYLLLAALSYLPVLATAPGKVAADTKQYLYLDPTRLMERAWSMWDPNIGMGTVTHQNIGYLFPMGPFYWVLDRVGLPDWVAQRLWLGSIIFAAGLGMLYLFRTLGARGSGAVVGALAYMLSPYLLDYAARISVILLPWAGLPFLLAFTIRALRRGGWRYAALFALTVQVVGSVNATALVFVGVAPLLWLPYAWLVLREVRFGRLVATVAKIGALTLAASLWWMSGLWAQGSYGVDILKFTETLRAVSRTTLPNEVLRGLGYWFFYGRDKLGPWIEASNDYTQTPGMILLSYGIPVLALASAALVRWRHRAFFILVAFVGVVIAVGAHPYDSPTPFGAIFKHLGETWTPAFALRSTGRAAPLVVLGLAVLLASGVNAVVRWLDERRAAGRRSLPGHLPGVAVAVVMGALVIANLPALWNGTFYGTNLQRDEDIPEYWKDAAAHLDAQGDATRVMELPGVDFASYRWGNTVDPITPGIMDRPYVARELIPYGSPASANLLNAYDLRIQNRQLPADALAPMADVMSVGDYALRNDIQFERYRVLRPQFLWDLFTPTPAGLGAPTGFGAASNVQTTQYPFLDEQALGSPDPLVTPHAVEVFPVEDPTHIVHTAPSTRPVVLAGDGDGIVDAASVGLLNGRPLVLYSAGFGQDTATLRRQIRADATLVVTDSNRQAARRWSTVTDTIGYTEGPGSHPLTRDLTDAQLDLFPESGTSTKTITLLQGVKGVAANSYGNPITYTPEDRAARAFDGDPYTAWRTGAFDDVRGDRIRVVLDHPITTDHVNLVQVLKPPNERWVTRAVLTFDGGSPVTADIGAASRTVAGQTVRFPKRTFSTFQLEIRDTNLGQLLGYGGVSPVGFGEIRLRDDAPGAPPVRVHEILRMPTDLLTAAGPASVDQPLVLLMRRQRVIPVPPRSDPELSMVRQFTLPTGRGFGVAGQARLATSVPDDRVDRLLGYTGPVVATSSAHLPGAPQDRASAALDGNPATAWVTPYSTIDGEFLDLTLPAPTTLDHLDLQVVADGRHSVPTRLRISTPEGEHRTVTLPAVKDRAEPNATVAVPVSFPALTGSSFRVTITGHRPVTTHEWYCECDLALPVGIAELGAAAIPPVTVPAQIPDECRSDLVTVDGRPVPVRILGSTADALALRPLPLVACADPGAVAQTAIPAGTRVLRTATGADAGFDVDQLTLASGAGGRPWAGLTPTGTAGPVPATAGTAGAGPATPTVAPGPKVHVVSTGRAKVEVQVTGATKPFWLALGQSVNPGWDASVDGRSIGGSTVVDGYANGWLVRPAADGRPLAITMEWLPQRTVNRALFLSALAVLACLGIVVGSWIRRRRRLRAGIVDPVSPQVVEDDAPAVVVSPFVAFGARPSTLAVVLTTVVALGLGAFFVKPWVGALFAVAVVAALLRPRWRALLTVVPVVGLAACGAFIAVKQIRGHFMAVFEWPTFFWQVRTLGWVVILFLAGDAIVEIVRTRRRPEGGEARGP